MPHIPLWYPEAKFGVFIHWVLRSAVKPPVWDEAVARPDFDTRGRYELARYFTAEKYDPAAWAQQFRQWGARYAVLTSRHEGDFNLFGHPSHSWDATTHGPKRDLVGPYVSAMREAGLKVGLYYNLISGHPDLCLPAEDPARWQRYMKFVFDEVRHLLTAYGKIDLIWFDNDWGRTAEEWRSGELAEMIQTLQPHIVITNRLRHRYLGHVGTPEQDMPLAPPHDFYEMCDTLGEDWWYTPGEKLKNPPELVRLFGDSISMNMNYLLNISPLGDGTIAPEQSQRMAALGGWITRHAEAVYGTEEGLPFGLFNGASTHKHSTLYLIAYDQPRPDLVVKGIRTKVKQVTHLASGKPHPWRMSTGHPGSSHSRWLFVTVPPDCMDQYATVVKVEFEGPVAEFDTPTGRLRWRASDRENGFQF